MSRIACLRFASRLSIKRGWAGREKESLCFHLLRFFSILELSLHCYCTIALPRHRTTIAPPAKSMRATKGRKTMPPPPERAPPLRRPGRRSLLQQRASGCLPPLPAPSWISWSTPATYLSPPKKFQKKFFIEKLLEDIFVTIFKFQKNHKYFQNYEQFSNFNIFVK